MLVLDIWMEIIKKHQRKGFMQVIIESLFLPEEMELIHQQANHLSSFFEGTGTVTFSKKISHKGKIKIKMKVHEGDSKMILSSVGNNTAECMYKIKNEADKLLQEISDEVISNAQRIMEINEIFKNTKIH